MTFLVILIMKSDQRLSFFSLLIFKAKEEIKFGRHLKLASTENIRPFMTSYFEQILFIFSFRTNFMTFYLERFPLFFHFITFQKSVNQNRLKIQLFLSATNVYFKKLFMFKVIREN